MKTRFHKISKSVTYNIPVGCWLVTFIPIHAGEGEPNPDAVVEVDVTYSQVTEADTHLHNREVDDNPCEVEYSDTHDLRDRLFTTEAMARDHAEWTIRRFEHPQPWESFVKL